MAKFPLERQKRDKNTVRVSKKLIWLLLAIIALLLASFLAIFVVLTMQMSTNITENIQQVQYYKDEIEARNRLLEEGYPCSATLVGTNGNKVASTFMVCEEMTNAESMADLISYNLDFTIDNNIDGLYIDFINAEDLVSVCINGKAKVLDKNGKVFISLDELLNLTGFAPEELPENLVSEKYQLEILFSTKKPSDHDTVSYSATLWICFT